VRRLLYGDDGPGRDCSWGSIFRFVLIGYVEGIDSKRGIAGRAADSLALRDFVGVGLDPNATALTTFQAQEQKTYTSAEVSHI
jgi:transposase